MNTLDSIRKDRVPHGTHGRYVSGCRCDDCKAGHCAYNKQRYRAIKLHGDWNGLVDAAPARRHLIWLSSKGVGRDPVHDVAGVSLSVLGKIRSGERKKIQARTSKKILAVGLGARADKSIVSARRAWRWLTKMLEAGFSKAELARRLGYRSPALQVRRDFITAKNEKRIEKLYRHTMCVDPLAPLGRPKLERAAHV